MARLDGEGAPEFAGVEPVVALEEGDRLATAVGHRREKGLMQGEQVAVLGRLLDQRLEQGEPVQALVVGAEHVVVWQRKGIKMCLKLIKKYIHKNQNNMYI
jgi:hypothetical protein